jgi:acetyltransferase
LPEKVDLAVVVTPAVSVPGIIKECAAVGIPGAIVISAGFKETGPAGVALEQQMLETARKAKMRIIGPNCFGVMVPHNGLNATFAATMANPGSVGFISQSGALCTAVLDWSFKEKVGFSAFMSIGSMLDVGWGDLIHYLGDDPKTKAIVIYMESVGDARSFLSAAREVALTKPIVVIKAGRTAAAAKAASSHTGSLTGSDDVLDAAFRRVGVLRVNTIAELFNMAEVVGKQPRPRGNRLSIITNAGGPGVLATDSLILSGGKLADLSKETMEKYNALLPAHWSHNNPVDILGDAGPERYAKAIQIAAADPANDGILVILTPQDMTDPTGTAEAVKAFAHLPDRPILASWMGGPDVAKGEAILNDAGMPTFAYPDTGARAFQYMWRYSESLRELYETPALARLPGGGKEGRAQTEKILAAARKSGRTILTEFESKKVLEAYGIPTVPTFLAKTPAEAVKVAEKLGYPVVIKLHSEIITHKTDVGGVKLNLRNAAALKKAWSDMQESVVAKGGKEAFLGVTVQPMASLDGFELILGSSVDKQFGPVLLFGAGGQWVEIFKDSALGLPPLNATLARRMMEQTKIFHALQGARGKKPVDLNALSQLLVRFSQLVIEQPWIAEIDINPLLASSERLIALDARVLLHGPKVTEAELPRPAIRPYPSQYAAPGKLKDGTKVTIRPIRPEDEPAMVRFHQSLGERSVYYRYFSVLKLSERVAHERLTRICFNDYDREIALVVELANRQTGENDIIGVARLSRQPGEDEAEFALIIADQWQGKGLGTELLKRLVQIGREEKLARISARTLPDNREMQAVCRKAGFTVKCEPGDSEARAEITL